MYYWLDLMALTYRIRVRNSLTKMLFIDKTPKDAVRKERLWDKTDTNIEAFHATHQ